MITSYRDSVEDCADHNGELRTMDLMKLLHDHNVGWHEWSAECQSHNVDKVMEFLGY